MATATDVLSWLHFGDLHITEKGRQNHRDFLALIEQANRHLTGAAEFALLPGDNADDGTEAQFRLVRRAIDGLRLPLRILPGDHDVKPGSLDAYHDVLGADRLPQAATIAGHRCLFLDVVSAGDGGPDFRLGAAQRDWLQGELEAATHEGVPSVVFMHTYPADLREDAAEVAALLARHRVAVVDMGHTHYNELANDGRTIFAATRSTGQIEEGPVGFSLVTIDHGAVSWRFKPLASAWPFVLVTSPVDHRLLTVPAQIVREACDVRAKIWDADGIAAATCRVDDGPALPMTPVHGVTGLWACTIDTARMADGLHRLAVRAESSSGGSDEDVITILVSRSDVDTSPERAAAGSDANAIGAWPEKGLLGTQLGPNRNGRKW